MNSEMWLAFLLASFLISLSPGAGAINTMSNGLSYGVRNTLPAIIGLQLGLGAQIIIVGIGLGALLASSDTVYTGIKWVGVGYLLWLGISKWRQVPRPFDATQDSRDSRKYRFWQAALVNLTNPKATVFLLALFPQFIDASAPHASQLVIMGSTLIGVDILVMVGYASLVSRLSGWMRDEVHQRWQNRIFGSLFIGIAALMAGYRNSL